MSLKKSREKVVKKLIEFELAFLFTWYYSKMILIFIKQLLTKIVACTTRYVKQPNVGGLNTFFVSDFCIYYYYTIQ